MDYLRNTCYISGTILGLVDASVNKRTTINRLVERLYCDRSWGERQKIKKISGVYNTLENRKY